jgi:hypothetical protein
MSKSACVFAARKEVLIVSVRARLLRSSALVLLAMTMVTASPKLTEAAASCPTCVAMCASQPDHSRVVHLWLFNQTRMDDGTLAEIVGVANRIWMPYGLAIEPGQGPDAIKIVVSPGMMPSPTTAPGWALGDTLFTEGHASPYIHLWRGAAEALAMNSEIEGRTFTSRPIVERDRILVHMLAVALAHELGHYLLDSSRHSTAGLLRATIEVNDLAYPQPSHLRLTSEQRRRICLTRPDVLAEHDGPRLEPHGSN